MNQMIIIHPQPNCDICGEKMKEWTAFAKTHHHIECLSKKWADDLIDIVKKSLNKD